MLELVPPLPGTMRLLWAGWVCPGLTAPVSDVPVWGDHVFLLPTGFWDRTLGSGGSLSLLPASWLKDCPGSSVGDVRSSQWHAWRQGRSLSCTAQLGSAPACLCPLSQDSCPASEPQSPFWGLRDRG